MKRGGGGERGNDATVGERSLSPPSFPFAARRRRRRPPLYVLDELCQFVDKLTRRRLDSYCRVTSVDSSYTSVILRMCRYGILVLYCTVAVQAVRKILRVHIGRLYYMYARRVRVHSALPWRSAIENKRMEEGLSRGNRSGRHRALEGDGAVMEQ